MTQRSLQIGVSGGIGSGKSTICKIFERRGATLIDLDGLSRASTAEGGSAIQEVKRVFGSDFIDPSGAMDRKKMRALVFSEPLARAKLESIIHPLIASLAARQAKEAQKTGAARIVFDIPLLLESSHWRSSLDKVVMVDCLLDTQIRRVQDRSGLSAPEVHAIIQVQSTRAQRLHAADAVVFNENKSLLEIEREIENLEAQFGL